MRARPRPGPNAFANSQNLPYNPRHTMKKALITLVLLICVFSLQNAAYAAGSSVKKNTFFDSLIAGIKDFFSGSKVDAENVDMSGARGSLLQLLNKYEFFVRVNVSGSDMYLKRDSILAKLKEGKEAISKSSEISPNHKTSLLESLELIEGNLRLNLVDAPQEKTKPVVLNAFDEVEAMVFKMSQEEASAIEKIVVNLGISSDQP